MTIRPRPLKYGEGETHRVIEIPIGELSLGINMGDIAQVPTEAVLFPSIPSLHPGAGAIENALIEVAGIETYEEYRSEAQRLIAAVLHSEGFTRAVNARLFADFLQLNTGMSIPESGEEIARDILDSCSVVNEYGEINRLRLRYGMSIPIPSGGLSKRGIKLLICTNVLNSDAPMTVEDMAMFTFSACKIAELCQVDSISVPSIGTGFLSLFGIGLSPQESLKGFKQGALRFVRSQIRSSLKHIDYNVYCDPTEKNAKSVADCWNII